MARKTDKKPYRIRNWSAYNEALVQRGSITLWLDEASLSRWYGNERAGKPGRPTVYSDWAIQTALVLRALESLVRSVMALMGLALSVPDFSTFSRRQQTLGVSLPRRVRAGEGLHLAIDSSGLKIYGEGEWQRQVQGAGRRRRWRKLHLAVDTASKQVNSKDQFRQEQAIQRHGASKTGRCCRKLLDDFPRFWTFLDRSGVPMTNNTAERALRPYVIWRRSASSASHIAATVSAP